MYDLRDLIVDELVKRQNLDETTFRRILEAFRSYANSHNIKFREDYLLVHWRKENVHNVHIYSTFSGDKDLKSILDVLELYRFSICTEDKGVEICKCLGLSATTYVVREKDFVVMYVAIH